MAVGIIAIIVIWLVSAFIYSKVKHISFGKSIFGVILALISEIFSNPSSGVSEAKRRAQREGNEEMMNKVEEMEAARENFKANVDNIKNTIEN